MLKSGKNLHKSVRKSKSIKSIDHREKIRAQERIRMHKGNGTKNVADFVTEALGQETSSTAEVEKVDVWSELHALLNGSGYQNKILFTSKNIAKESSGMK